MTQRKVGQDMIIKKKSSTSTRIVSHSHVDTRKISTAPNVHTQPKISPVVAEEYTQKKTAALHFSEKPNRSEYGNRYEPAYSQEHYEPRPPARGGILWFFVGVSIVALIGIVVSLIAQATINLSINESTYTVDTPLDVYAEPTEGQVAFKTAQIIDKQSIVVPTSNKQPFSAVATGAVKLFSSNIKPVTIPSGTQLVSSTKKTYITKKNSNYSSRNKRTSKIC